MDKKEQVLQPVKSNEITMSKIKFWGLFVLSFFVGAIGYAMVMPTTGSENEDITSPTPMATVTSEPEGTPAEQPTPENTPTEVPVPTETITPMMQGEVSMITHEELYDMGSEAIGNTYKMELYLEQPPTSSRAEFMTENNVNSIENILITCSMSSSDLAKLDGDSTLQGNYPKYNVELEFEDYDDNLMYYTATCELVN